MRQLAIKANNFEQKASLIITVQQHQFIGHPSEDLNEHMGRFMRMTNIVKLNGVRLEVIRLQLFPFSLRDMVASWFESLPVESMTNWEDLVEAYMGRFFSPAQKKKNFTFPATGKHKKKIYMPIFFSFSRIL